MAECNSHSGQKIYYVSNYEAVFGQKYHLTLKCSLAEMRECRSISQRIWLSPDERLEKYVQENDIVDIEFDNMGLLLLLMMTMKMMKNMNGRTHPWSWMALPF